MMYPVCWQVLNSIPGFYPQKPRVLLSFDNPKVSLTCVPECLPRSQNHPWLAVGFFISLPWGNLSCSAPFPLCAPTPPILLCVFFSPFLPSYPVFFGKGLPSPHLVSFTLIPHVPLNVPFTLLFAHVVCSDHLVVCVCFLSLCLLCPYPLISSASYSPE